MSEKKVVANNILYLTIAELTGRILQFFFYKHISTALGTEAFGAYSWATTNVMYFFIIVGAGLDIFGIREISKNKEKINYYSNVILSLRIVLSVVAFFTLFIYAFYITDKSLEIKLLLVVAGVRLFGDAILPNWIYQAIEKMGYLAIRNFLFNFLNLILAYLLVKTPADTIYATGLLSFNLIITSIILLFHFNYKFIKIQFIFNLKDYWDFLKKSIPIGLSIQIIIFYNFADILMLGFLRENFEYEVGIYSAAMRIIMISTLPNQILQQSFFPKFANDDIYNKDSYFNKYTILTVVSGSFLTAIIIAYSEAIIQIQFSELYFESSILLKILALKLFLSYLSVTFSSPFLAKNNENIVLKVVGFAFVLNIILNYLTIPVYGIYGAAFSTIFCEVIISLLFYYQLYKKYNLINYKPLVYGIVVMIGVLIIYFITNNILNFNVYLSFIFSIFTFLFITIVSKVVTIQELKAIVKR